MLRPHSSAALVIAAAAAATAVPFHLNLACVLVPFSSSHRLDERTFFCFMLFFFGVSLLLLLMMVWRPGLLSFFGIAEWQVFPTLKFKFRCQRAQSMVLRRCQCWIFYFSATMYKHCITPNRERDNMLRTINFIEKSHIIPAKWMSHRRTKCFTPNQRQRQRRWRWQRLSMLETDVRGPKTVKRSRKKLREEKKNGRKGKLIEKRNDAIGCVWSEH